MATPSTAEIREAVAGVLALARLDPTGLDRLDASEDGFWKSFFAAVIVAPGYLLLLALRDYAAPPEGGALAMIVVEAIAYVCNWAAFPLAMIYVARAIDRTPRYALFIVAFNWSAVVQMAAFVAAATLTGVLPAPAAQGIMLAVTLAVLAYEWFIARVALTIGGGAAALVVALDLAIGLVINAVAVSIY